MGKPNPKAAPTPLKPEDVHQLYIQGKDANDLSLWLQTCKAYLGEFPSDRCIPYYPRLLCTDANEIKCEEFGQLAALLVHKNQWDYSFYLAEEIRLVEKERRRGMTFDFFMENAVQYDPAFFVGLWKAFIPYARLEDLKGMLLYANALDAMSMILNECPEHCKDLPVKVSNFYDLESPSARLMTTEQKSMIEQNNTRLWFRRPLNIRIAAAYRDTPIWQVTEVDLEGLEETIKEKWQQLEASFFDGLEETRKPIIVEHEDDGDQEGGDDEATLVDVRC